MSSSKSGRLRIPLTVDGGIRAQSLARCHRTARNPVRARWWSKKWLEAIEGFRMGARLGRGRNYALSGQVGDLRIDEGLVQATVQGAAGEPYFCFIRFAVAEGDAKEEITRAICEDAVMYAQLLNGYMPENILPLFESFGLPLLPSRTNDIWSECSCPDYANPCKHLAAVYYLVCETIANSPLTLLKLRGIALDDDCSSETEIENESHKADSIPEIIDPSTFYSYDNVPPKWKNTAPPTETAPLLRRLGPLALWRGEERFEETMLSVYRRCSERAAQFWQ